MTTIKDVVAAAEEAAAEAAAIVAAMPTTNDPIVSDLIEDPASATSLALSATIAQTAGLNVKDFGAKGDGVTDDTAALRAAAAAGNWLVFPPGDYLTLLPEGRTLLNFVGRTGIIIDAPQARIIAPTSYVLDSFTTMFLFDNCRNVQITLGEYVGYTLPAPQTWLGYRGATVVRAINGTDGVVVDAKFTNARYGVHSGAYAAPSQGGCKNFDLRLRGSFCGYVIALYLAAGIRFDVDADDIHRAAYFAGCDSVQGVARWKNIYIAPTALLLTDALTAGTDAAAQADPVGAATSSRGCSNVDVISIDKGSTIFQAETYCVGISLSRADPLTYRNIRMRFSVVATDTLSTTVHGFIINSAAKTTWSRYAFAWEPVVVLDNIRVSGTLDKSASTVSVGAQGPFTIRAYETSAAHAGTIRGLVLEDIVIKQGSAGMAAAVLYARGLVDAIRFLGVNIGSAWLSLDTSNTIPTIITSSTMSTIDTSALSGGSRLAISGGSTVAAISGTTARTEVQGSTVRGAGPVQKMVELTAALIGTTVTLSNAIPTGCILLAVQGRVTTAVAGATGYQVGVSGDLTRFVNTNTLTAGTAFGPSAGTDASVRYYQANTDLIITSKTSAFTGGVLRLMLTYLEFPALAS